MAPTKTTAATASTNANSWWSIELAPRIEYQLARPMYNNQDQTMTLPDVHLARTGPPSSQPNAFLRNNRRPKAAKHMIENTLTENASSPAATLRNGEGAGMTPGKYRSDHSASSPRNAQYMEAIVHGSPRPRKTLTELLPVTLTTEASAVGSSVAADKDAKRSGILVPTATNVMAVTRSSMPTTQPKISAMSAMTAVTPASQTKDM
mmetsp:Transcript_108930/g.313793  ORF Transcript_108930/g.313793 Transcript_108930/m.313793 type:complete len:206 (+) Transcript_108930:341-958(+)